MKKRLPTVLGAVLLLGACGGGESGSDIGKAGDASKATRTIEIRQLDTRRFDPAQIEVRKGETVTVRVTNTATSLHEFYLADQKGQDAHQREMAAMGDAEMKMSDTRNRLFPEPGETKSVTWTFGDAGEVPFACHMPGHYQAGMRGAFRVT